MFEQVMVAEMDRGHRAWTTMLGMAGQTLLVAGAVLVPLVSPQALPHVRLLPAIFTPSAPAPPPPHVRIVAVERVLRPTQVFRNTVLLPTSIPAKAALIEDPPLAADTLSTGGTGGVPGGVEDGVPGGLLNSIVGSVPPPKPPAAVAKAVATPPPAAAAEPPRIRVGGIVLESKLINKVIPIYPILARQARISGTVELLGVVGTDGRIRSLQVVSGHPLLIRAALDAVRQWVYTPTRLNDEPVEVMAPITVSFVLNR